MTLLRDSIALSCLSLAIASAAAAEPVSLGTFAKCSDTYFLRQPGVFGWKNSVVAELLIRLPEEPSYSVRGILFNGDWGVLRVCAPWLNLKVRWLVDPSSLGSDVRRVDERELAVQLDGQTTFVTVARGWSLLDASAGQAMMRDIEASIGRAYTASGNNLGRAQYGDICSKCEQLAPLDSNLAKR